LKFLKIDLKTFNLALFFAMACAVLITLAGFDASCEDLRQNVLRLHIIANSNSVADQELKLKVRDKLLEQSGELFCDSESIDDAITVTNASLPQIEQCVSAVLKSEGANYAASAKVDETYFETREYDTFTLPAGNYNSLVITLGEGEGKNWWCVIFPEVCLPLGDSDLSKSTTKDAAEIAQNPVKYKARFKVVEIYEDIKQYFK